MANQDATLIELTKLKNHMDYYIGAIQKYAVFDGRARRKEYWMFVLFNILISLVIAVIGNLINVSWLGLLYGLAVLIPNLALGVRRLHDIDRTGWWLLIGLIPLIGAIILLFFFATDSQPGQNQYGPNPKSL